MTMSNEKKLEQEHIDELEMTSEDVSNQLEEVEEEYSMPDGLVLDIRSLGMQFGGLKAVDELSFNIQENEIVGLIGPNGAGKTTVFNCITQFYKENTGEVWMRNKFNEAIRLNDIHLERVIHEGLVRTFQNVELIGDLSIVDNLHWYVYPRYKTIG